MRSNHFHAGIDFRSSHRPLKDSIFAVADGYVSRIKVQSGSYGQSLYIDHPNGYTSVYAHLHEYAPKVGYHLKKVQYENEKAHVDYYLDSTKVYVKQGEFIGTMGNTGRSSGPHLHFEIRETESEIPINPYFFNLKPKDTRDPLLRSIHLHSLSENGQFVDREFIATETHNNWTRSKRDTLYTSSPFVGFAVGTFDQMNGVNNLNGTYKISLSVADSLQFVYELDRISFEETRYINAAIDYPYKKTIGNSVIRLYKTPGNLLSLYERNDFKGVFPVSNKAKEVIIRLEDFEGNEKKIKLYVARKAKTDAKKTNYSLRYDTNYVIQNGELSLSIPEYSFDQNIAMRMYAQSDDKIVIGDPKIPVFKYLELSIARENGFAPKTFLGKRSSSGSISNVGSYVKKDTLYAHIRSFGEYALVSDLKAPTVTKISMNSQKEWRFSLKDNYKQTGHCIDIQIRCLVDGKWIRHYYDKKNDLILVKDISLLPKNAKELVILATDPVGNESSYTFQI